MPMRFCGATSGSRTPRSRPNSSIAIPTAATAPLRAALQRIRTRAIAIDSPRAGARWPGLAGASVAGGVVAPVLLLWGLSQSGAAETALLLNFEGVITALAAAMLFREAVGARVWLAALVMVGRGGVVASDPTSAVAVSP